MAPNNQPPQDFRQGFSAANPERAIRALMMMATTRNERQQEIRSGQTEEGPAVIHEPYRLDHSRIPAEIWTEFRTDHELLERLQVTPQEIDALEHCVMLGTLTCKQDLLFILRQIREATGPALEPVPGARVDSFPAERLGTATDSPRLTSKAGKSLAATATPFSNSMAEVLQRQSSEYFLLLAASVIAVGGLVWGSFAGLYVLSNSLTALGIGAFKFAWLPGFEISSFAGGLKSIVALELTFVSVFALVFTRDRWKTMRRFREYRRGASHSPRMVR